MKHLALLLLLAAPVLAVPTIRGATGLIFVPDAKLAQSTTAFFRDGKIGTGGTKNFMFMEGGISNRDSETFYDFKLQALPDITTDQEWIPAVAMGIRGVGKINDQREWYLAVTKKFSFPDCTLTWGLSKQEFWDSAKKSFWGIEVPLFAGISLLADRDGFGQGWNAGARWTFKKHFVIYDYVEDVRRKGPEPLSRRNLVGACYQSHF